MKRISNQHSANLQRFILLNSALLLSTLTVAESPPMNILYVGAIAINPCQDAQVLARWYSRFGIETQEIQGGYYEQLDTAAGPFFFGIHPKRVDAPKKCTASVAVVFRVDSIEARLLALKAEDLLPDSTEVDSQGQFAHFHDPDGNEVTLWEGKHESN